MQKAITCDNHKMASQSSGDLCPLCFCFRLEPLFYNEMSTKIEKYLQIKMEYSSAGICLNCYNSIEGFHEFYERVHLAQKNFTEKFLVPSGNEHQVTESEEIIRSDTKEFVFGEEKPEVHSPVTKDVPDAIDMLDQKENKSENVESVSKKEADENGAKVTKKKKLKHITFKNISSEIEKKMLEFYNIKCEKCDDFKCTSFKMLNKHYNNVHNTQGYIKCCKRNIRVNDKYYLRNHMIKHLQPDMCRCGVCGKELSSLATLKHHMILHKPTEERPFQCRECEKRFCCKNDLRNHEKAIHVPENERVDFICDVCGKVFHKVANLRYHYSSVHLQEKKYICEICARCFTTRSGLRTHLNAAHSTLGPIQCQECKKWLKTKDTYQKHLQLHQNYSYPCTYCSKVCNSSSSLRSHLVKHSEERPHSCTVCKKSFKTKTHLKNHSTQHLGGSKYKCLYCPKIFANMSNYYTHRRRMHSGETVVTKQEQELPVIKDDGYHLQDQLDLTQKNISDFKIEKNDSDSCSEVPVEVPAMRQNIIISPVKFL